MKERLKKLGRPSLPVYGTIVVICLVLLVVLFQPTFFSHAQSSQDAAPWDGNFVTYQVGATVSYEHNIYTCLQAHTSEPNWNPHDTPALWDLQSSDTAYDNNSVTPTATDITPTPTDTTLTPTPTPTDTTLTPTPTPTDDTFTPTPTATSTPPAENNGGPLPNSGNPPPGGAIATFSNPAMEDATLTCLKNTHPEASGDQLQPICATFYNDNGTMADGQTTHPGACAVWATQYPFGTTFDLYKSANPAPGDTPAYQCTAEDVFGGISAPGITDQDKIGFCQNHIDVWNADVTEDINLGVQPLYLKVTGQNQAIASAARQNNPDSPGCGLSWS